MNLEPAIIVSIIGAIVSVFGFIITYRTAKGKNQSDVTIAQGDAKSKLDARIDARVTEQLDTAWKKVDEQDEKIRGLEKDLRERDDKISELERHMAASEKRETEMYGYIQELAAHILERKDPPPPTMPVNLVNHFGPK